jgi:hypothetical protein
VIRAIVLWLFLFLTANCAAQDEVALQKHLDASDFFRLRDELTTVKNISHIAWLYYSAIVDNAFNRNELAIKRADSFFAHPPAGWSPQQILRLQEMLMDSYGKTGRYKDAADISAIVLSKYNDNGKAGLANSRKIWVALSNVPAQVVEHKQPISLPIAPNSINLIEMPVRFGKSTEVKFIFDTGANISAISETYAKKYGLRVLNTSFEVNAAQGRKVRSQLAVADSLWMGNSLVRNAVFIVMPDDKLSFPQVNVQLKGIIGFPVISAFKEIHITSAQLTIPVAPDNTKQQNMALNGLTPLVQAQSGKDTLVFQFDTGAAKTNLFSNYFEQNKATVKAEGKKQKRTLMSAGGAKAMKTRDLSQFHLQIGDDYIILPDVAVYTRRIQSFGDGIAVGNIGQDVINHFSKMVLNFDRMYVDFR